jgi:hypothetical protein
MKDYQEMMPEGLAIHVWSNTRATVRIVGFGLVIGGI